MRELNFKIESIIRKFVLTGIFFKGKIIQKAHLVDIGRNFILVLCTFIRKWSSSIVNRCAPGFGGVGFDV